MRRMSHNAAECGNEKNVCGSCNSMIMNKIETYQDVVSVVCWNLSHLCQIDKPVTHVYMKITNCSSRVIFCDGLKPMAPR